MALLGMLKVTGERAGSHSLRMRRSRHCEEKRVVSELSKHKELETAARRFCSAFLAITRPHSV